ncbi:ATP-binding cassette domain-containing protein [Oecophyllibacter saccharovorans]|uniref:ATP-binding cassette domain-containing protein n=1 Tax=Oecophyllibacter saccharovorans TaxID=2558360 RepID=UPI00116D4DA6|nr:ATP-binding cassette domain-containing protein [Oecophyllibacter saccharovorans]TPW34939.1 ATP-binding cassette domain-containing protein [Oecophyllibacter saccharovorans]
MIILDHLPFSPASKAGSLQAGNRHGFSLRLARGDIGWITGPAGSGKTALLELLALRRPLPEAGMRILGQVITKRTAASELARLRRNIGLIEERPSFHDDWSLLANVCFPLRLVDKPQSRDRILHHGEAILRWAGLGQHMHEPAGTLSATQQLRLGMARALIRRPDLVLVDAPALQLDPELRDLLLGAFAEMKGKSCAILLATQDPALPERLPGPVHTLAGPTQSGNFHPHPSAHRGPADSPSFAKPEPLPTDARPATMLRGRAGARPLRPELKETPLTARHDPHFTLHAAPTLPSSGSAARGGKL